MFSDTACIYCGYDGGFHGCRDEARHVIQKYWDSCDVFDVDELTDLIGSLGYYA